jgi:hypothetical protein
MFNMPIPVYSETMKNAMLITDMPVQTRQWPLSDLGRENHDHIGLVYRCRKYLTRSLPLEFQTVCTNRVKCHLPASWFQS